jgi:hypothetical protein
MSTQNIKHLDAGVFDHHWALSNYNCRSQKHMNLNRNNQDHLTGIQNSSRKNVINSQQATAVMVSSPSFSKCLLRRPASENPYTRVLTAFVEQAFLGKK